mmetsp:Transcript_24848/g.30052  ORF Transcript_24848/g.30052 Transcript_24848/m.30052 type:complete len:274 (-) Transcript_24848:943-1764(-)
MEAALDLVRRMPPSNIQENLTGLVDMAPDLTEELLSRVDQPLQIAFDEVANKDFLLCDYNRDGDSYRSPWSNRYFPEIDDGAAPSDDIRALEVEANGVFDAYRDQYYEGGVSSVYLWDTDAGFAGCFLIKKGDGDSKRGLLDNGFWDAIHVVEVIPEADEVNALYSLTSTVMLHLGTKTKQLGGFSLGGNLTRQVESSLPISEGHIVNIGTMIEDMENKLRNTLDQVYFGKTQDVVKALRVPTDGTVSADSKEGKSLQASLISEMLKKQLNKK